MFNRDRYNNYENENFGRGENNFDRAFDAREYSRDYNRDFGGRYDNNYQEPDRDNQHDPARPYDGYRPEEESPRYNRGDRVDRRGFGRRYDNYEPEQQPQPEQRPSRYPRGQYVPQNNYREQYEERKPIQNNIPADDKSLNDVKLCYPKDYQDIQNLITFLKNKQALLVNVEKLTPEKTQRFLDFLSGAIFALSGSCQQVGKGLFLFTPSGVSISKSQGLNDSEKK